MDYRIAYEEIICALFQYEKTQGNTWVKLMLEVRRIEGNIDKTMPPIQLASPPKQIDDRGKK